MINPTEFFFQPPKYSEKKNTHYEEKKIPDRTNL